MEHRMSGRSELMDGKGFYSRFQVAQPMPPIPVLDNGDVRPTQQVVVLPGCEHPADIEAGQATGRCNGLPYYLLADIRGQPTSTGVLPLPLDGKDGPP